MDVFPNITSINFAVAGDYINSSNQNDGKVSGLRDFAASKTTAKSNMAKFGARKKVHQHQTDRGEENASYSAHHFFYTCPLKGEGVVNLIGWGTANRKLVT